MKGKRLEAWIVKIGASSYFCWAISLIRALKLTIKTPDGLRNESISEANEKKFFRCQFKRGGHDIDSDIWLMS